MTTAINTYVQNLYQNILQRNPEAAGLAYWDSAAVGGLTSMSMVENFIVSAEAQNITALLRLYDVFFNRAADSVGLNYWLVTLKGGASLHDIAMTFSASSEFQVTHATSTTAQYVEALYGNLFARTSDAPSKALWVKAIDNGSMTRAEVALAFTLSAEAKVETGAATRFAESYLALCSAGIKDPPTVVVAALAQKSLAAVITELQTVHGTVQNGIIQRANVFRDGDGDGLPDTGEIQNSTDANGDFTLVGGYGDIIVIGGTDLTTGKVNDKVLSAPTDKIINTIADLDNMTMVTPLTTIVKAMTDQGVEVATAVSKLNTALGLDANFNPLNFDHSAAATSATSTEAQQKAAVAIKGAIAQVTVIMENSAGLIKGAAGIQTDLDAGEITADVARALADKIIAVTADVTTPPTAPLMALESQTLIQEIINATAASVSAASATPISVATITSISDLAAEAAQVIGGLNSTVKESVGAINNATTFDASKIIDAFSAIAKSEALSQDTIQTAITEAATGGDLTAFVGSFTGANLTAAITASPIGEIVAGVSSTAGGSVLSEALVAAGLPSPSTPEPPADTTAPAMSAAAVSSDGKSIVITYSEALSGTAEAGDYVVALSAGSTSITNALRSGSTVTLTVPGVLASATVDSIVYTAANGTANSIKDVAGNNAASQILSSSIANGSKAQTVADASISPLAGYSLLDTAADLYAAAAGVLHGATTITATDAATVAQATAIDAAANPGPNTYNITDSVANLSTADNAILVTAGIVTVNGTGADDLIDMSGFSKGMTINGAEGNDTITGSTGNDIIIGGTGIDTVVYSGSLMAADITAAADIDSVTAGNQPGWRVSAGANGIDFLTGVEKITDGTHNFLLVSNSGNGGYGTIQDAITAAAASGDTIIVAAGTYAEALTITKPLTITSADASAKAHITGSGTRTTINSSNVILRDLVYDLTGDTSTDGVLVVDRGGVWPTFTIAYDNISLSGLEFYGGRRAMYLTASDVMIENSVFQNQFRDAIFFNAASGTTTIRDNVFSATTLTNKAVVFENFSSGDPATSGTISVTGNTLTGKANLLVYNQWQTGGSGVDLTVSGNTVRGTLSAAVSIYDSGPDFDRALFAKLNSIVVKDNDFSGAPVGVELPIRARLTEVQVGNNVSSSSGQAMNLVGIATVDAQNVWLTNTEATLQSVIDSATAGDTIIAAAGTYNEQISIAKKLSLALAGGSSIDMFSFSGAAGATTSGSPFGTSFDAITGFQAGSDKLQFSNVVEVVSAQQTAVQTAVTALASATDAQIFVTMAQVNTTDLGVSFATYGGNSYVLFERTGSCSGNAADDVSIKLIGLSTAQTFAGDVIA